MATATSLYGTTKQTITCTITSLANGTNATGAGRASTAVDNSGLGWLDAWVTVQVKTSASALGSDKVVYVYAYGTSDTTGPTYSDGITGTDAGFTATNPMNLRQLGVINCPSVSTTYTCAGWSVAACLGLLPVKWGIYVVNFTGQTLDASVGSAWYQGSGLTIA